MSSSHVTDVLIRKGDEDSGTGWQPSVSQGEGTETGSSLGPGKEQPCSTPWSQMSPCSTERERERTHVLCKLPHAWCCVRTALDQAVKPPAHAVCFVKIKRRKGNEIRRA